MKNPADLTEVCKKILEYHERGEMAKDVIEQSVYTLDELLHELALVYVRTRPSIEWKYKP